MRSPHLNILGMTMTKSTAAQASPNNGGVVRIALYLGIAGAIVWIVGELGQLVVSGSQWIEPTAGTGIIGTALLPFALLLGQGNRALNISFFGAFLITTGAFLLGVLNLLGQTPAVLEAAGLAWGTMLYDLGGAAYVLGSIAFAGGIIINGRYNPLYAIGIGACAAAIVLTVIVDLSQVYASVSNIVLASLLIAISIDLINSNNRTSHD